MYNISKNEIIKYEYKKNLNAEKWKLRKIKDSINEKNMYLKRKIEKVTSLCTESLIMTDIKRVYITSDALYFFFSPTSSILLFHSVFSGPSM